MLQTHERGSRAGTKREGGESEREREREHNELVSPKRPHNELLYYETRLAAQHYESKREAAKAIADRDAAVTELQRTKRNLQEMENVRASRHAINTFTLEALGAGSHNAGGAKAKNKSLRCARPSCQH